MSRHPILELEILYCCQSPCATHCALQGIARREKRLDGNALSMLPFKQVVQFVKHMSATQHYTHHSISHNSTVLCLPDSKLFSGSMDDSQMVRMIQCTRVINISSVLLSLIKLLPATVDSKYVHPLCRS